MIIVDSFLTSGVIELMLDRILNQDDGKGMGEMTIDNVPVTSDFTIVIEPFTRPWVSFSCSPSS